MKDYQFIYVQSEGSILFEESEICNYGVCNVLIF